MVSGWFRRSFQKAAWLLVVLLLTLIAACAPTAAPPPDTSPPAKDGAPQGTEAKAQAGSQLLNDLVNQARQEGSLRATIQSSWTADLAPPLAEGFKAYFGLNNLGVSITAIGSEQALPLAVAETRTGAPATYDAMIMGTEAESMQLIGAGAVRRIENWEGMLREINPLVGQGGVGPDELSTGPLEGQAFLIAGYIKQMLYNTQLIDEQELPSTHADLADPRYEGRFVQPPWTSHWDIGPAVVPNVDRSQWLDTIRESGRITGAVLTESAGTERVLLGEYAFVLGQDTHYRRTLGRDAQAPLGFKYFDDYNPYTGVYYLVREGSRSPAAGTLFALWMTTPDAQAIWQPATLLASPYGQSELDVTQRDAIRESGARITNFLDTAETIELLNWYDTDEGARYLEDMGRAIRGE